MKEKRKKSTHIHTHTYIQTKFKVHDAYFLLRHIVVVVSVLFIPFHVISID